MLRRLFLLASIVLLAGCTDPTLPEDAFISGVITALHPDRGLLVEARGLTAATSAASVRVDSRTDILWKGGERGSADHLQVGTFVSVWTTGPVLLSNPPQVYASKVLIHPTVVP